MCSLHQARVHVCKCACRRVCAAHTWREDAWRRHGVTLTLPSGGGNLRVLLRGARAPPAPRPGSPRVPGARTCPGCGRGWRWGWPRVSWRVPISHPQKLHERFFPSGTLLPSPNKLTTLLISDLNYLVPISLSSPV